MDCTSPRATFLQPKETMTTKLVRSSEIAWTRGLDTVAAMPEGYAGNLGPDGGLADTYSRWEQKTLLNDPDTTRRIDLVRLLPGFEDPGPAYHESVEECLVIEGGCDIQGEGPVVAGDYFWRPPGWVHAAHSRDGFVGLLMQEGVSEGDASGRATRRMRPAEDLGRNVLFDDLDTSIGPRGWIRRLPSSLRPWVPASLLTGAEDWIGMLDHPSLRVKILSRNWKTGAQSLLARFDPGSRDPAPHQLGRRLIGYVISGELVIGETILRRGDLISRPAVSPPIGLSSSPGCVLFMKLGGC